jgi:hypothetical protein
MLSPNAVITPTTAARYFPTVDPATLASPVFQDMLDDAMAEINETLGIDLSNGPGVEVSQTFQPDTSMNQMLRMVVPMDAARPVTITEGTNARVMSTTEFTRYALMVMSGGVYQNYYWFDRGHIFGTNFQAPTVVTYTPRDTVFRVIKEAILDLVKVRLMGQGMDATSIGLGAVSSVTDEAQTVSFSQGNNGSSATNTKTGRVLSPSEQILNALLLRFRGPRIG